MTGTGTQTRTTGVTTIALLVLRTGELNTITVYILKEFVHQSVDKMAYANIADPHQTTPEGPV